MTASDINLFRAGDWHVQPQGLVYCPDSPQEYVIERADLGCAREDGASFWIMHMLEKSWVDMEDFTSAFRRALKLDGVVSNFDWDRTQAEAFAHIYQDFCCIEAQRRLGRGNEARLVRPIEIGEEMQLADSIADSFWRPLENIEKWQTGFIERFEWDSPTVRQV